MSTCSPNKINIDNPIPSTSQDYQKDHKSPALARSVPSSHEATSPAETAANSSKGFYYFTTEMANQAALDIDREKDKLDSLLQWVTRKKMECIETPCPPSSSSYKDFSDTPASEPVDLDDIDPTLGTDYEIRGIKRKHEDDPITDAKIQKLEENPLRRLEMMSASKHFNNINEVVDASGKKDERMAKLEKLEDIKRSVEEEMMMKDMQQQAQMKRMTTPNGQQFSSPGQYPPPGGAPPQAGPFSTGTFPGHPWHPMMYPNQAAPMPPRQQPYGYGYPFPPGYPMSAPGKMPFPSPSGMPPRMAQQNPQYLAQMHHMAQMAKMSPGMMQPQSAPSPNHSPFPPAASPAAMQQHQMMMMRQNGMHQPFGYPGMQQQQQQQNSMLMVARQQNGFSNETTSNRAEMPPQMNGAGWAPQLTPCYPPSFTAPVPPNRGMASNSTTPVK